MLLVEKMKRRRGRGEGGEAMWQQAGPQLKPSSAISEPKVTIVAD
jgi:hypothetical protein